MGANIRQVLNRLLVDLFNEILVAEEEYIQNNGIKLSMSEIHTLEAIDISEGQTMSEIAKKLRITQGTLSVNINRLTNKGYVYRVQDEKDRRVFRLKLTDKTKHILEVHQQFHDELVDRLVSQLSEEEEALLVDSLSQVNIFFESL